MSIGDLFGDQLESLLTEQPDETEAPDEGIEAVIQTALEQLQIDVPAKLDTSLTELGVRDLALWSLVGQVERELNVQLLDSVVLGWKTLGDAVKTLRELTETN